MRTTCSTSGLAARRQPQQRQGGARDSSRPGVADSAEAVHDALYGIIHQDALQSATHAIESVLGKWKSSLTHRLEMRAQQGQDRTVKKVDLKTR